MNKKVKHGTLLTVIFTLLSLLYLYPIILVFINSFKKKVYISKAPFDDTDRKDVCRIRELYPWY